MIHRFPKYYKDFVCLAGKCKDNCCRGKWDIEIDDDTYACYERAPEEIREKLLRAVRFKDEIPVFKVRKGGCTWLDENGLCSLYGSFGKEYQSQVCRQFPRFAEYFGDVKVSGLGLSCEEAARILFTCEDDAALLEESIEEEAFEGREYDADIAEIVFCMRDILTEITLIPDTNNEALAKTLEEYCDRFQEILDDFVQDKNKENALKLLEGFKGACSWESINEKMISPEEALERADAVYTAFSELPDIRRGFDEVLASIEKKLQDEELRAGAAALLREFDLYMYKNGRYDDYKRFMRYILYRYFAKAVFDRDVYLKGKILISFFSFLKLYDITRWLKNNKSFKLKDRVSTAKVFSGEVEYSEDNMQQLLEDFLFDEECF